MFRQIVPRVCRHLKSAPCRGYRRDLPIRLPWSRRAAPWDSFFSDMRPTFRAVDDHFRDMAAMMERMWSPMMHARPGPRSAAVGDRHSAAEVMHDGKVFEVRIDVQHYDAEEITVRQLEDRLVITGKHETRADDYGYVAREFTREFLLPENLDSESITSRLTEDGHLIIEARVKEAEAPTERVINIQKEGGEKKTEKEE